MTKAALSSKLPVDPFAAQTRLQTPLGKHKIPQSYLLEFLSIQMEGILKVWILMLLIPMVTSVSPSCEMRRKGLNETSDREVRPELGLKSLQNEGKFLNSWTISLGHIPNPF